MKKNLMMRAASVLLVAVMLTTCAISGTFAKYVTADDVNDSARVAKWGVEVTATGDLFAENYINAAGGNVAATSGELTVISSAAPQDNVVAPGTKNETGMTFTIKGTPEVDTQVSVVVTVNKNVFLAQKTKLADMTTGDADVFNNDSVYYPVVFTLKNGADEILATGDITVIQAYLNGLTGTYNANTNLNTIKSTADVSKDNDGTYKLTWAWDYGNVASDTGHDKQDTLLGNLAADAAAVNAEMAALNTAGLAEVANLVDGTDYNLDMNVAIAITVTQVD